MIVEVVRGARDARVRRPAVVQLQRAAHDGLVGHRDVAERHRPLEAARQGPHLEFDTLLLNRSPYTQFH